MADQRILKKNNAGTEPVEMEYWLRESLRKSRVPGFVLNEQTYSERIETQRHSHKHAIFCLALEGAYTAKFDRKICTCAPSSLIFHAPDEPHSEYVRPSSRIFIIEIEPSWLDRVREQTAVIESSADFKSSALTLLGRNIYQEFRESDEASPLVVEGLMLALIGKASRDAVQTLPVQPPRWLKQAKELLHDRFAETLTLAEIAAEVGVNSSYLAQMFHKYYRHTIGGYLRRLRVESACRTLAASDTPLCDIALAAGFSDQSHFNRIFKRYVGITPVQYRKAAGKF